MWWWSAKGRPGRIPRGSRESKNERKCSVWFRKERRFSGQTTKKQMKMGRYSPSPLRQTDRVISFREGKLQRDSCQDGQDRARKNEEQKCDPESDGEEVCVCVGVGGQAELREGAHLPLSCVSWPAVKSSSLPFSAGRPQGAIVPGWARETGTERGGQRFE